MTVERTVAPQRRDEDVVFNVVWTGRTFEQLQSFVASQLLHSAARFRFVVNCCPPDQLGLLEAFAERSDGRVVDVRVVAEDRMIRHGEALDRVLEATDDGPFFGLIDPDIRARGPFVGSLFAAMGEAAAVTSGTEVWSESNVLPDGQLGISGEYFFDRDGFVFGSPHLAVYERGPLVETTERWGVGFGTAGAELAPATLARLDELGRRYLVYDTGKLVNVLLQGDGHRLVHRELDEILHIGGLAHQIQPTGYLRHPDGTEVPDWKFWDGTRVRFEVTHHLAAVLRALLAGEPAPPVPPLPRGDLAEVATEVHDELVAMVEEVRHLLVEVPA